MPDSSAHGTSRWEQDPDRQVFDLTPTEQFYPLGQGLQRVTSESSLDAPDHLTIELFKLSTI